MRFSRATIVGLLFVVATFGGNEIANAADAKPTNTDPTPAPKPQYDPTAGTIVTGLEGVATGAQSALTSYRDMPGPKIFKSR